jgi:hypothetical protein
LGLSSVSWSIPSSGSARRAASDGPSVSPIGSCLVIGQSICRDDPIWVIMTQIAKYFDL